VVDEGLQALAERVEPLAVVDEFGVTERDLLLEMERVALDADLFEGLVGFVENGAAGRLVDAAGFHANETVLG